MTAHVGESAVKLTNAQPHMQTDTGIVHITCDRWPCSLFKVDCHARANMHSLEMNAKEEMIFTLYVYRQFEMWFFIADTNKF